MIADKDIGKLWEYYRNWNPQVCGIIGKLVAERTNHYLDLELDGPTGLVRAQRDFGIDPKTFEKEEA